MAKVELKQPIVEEIANNIKDAQAVVLVDYSGLTVEQDTILRKELRESGVQYKVYKNTLMRRAFEGTPCADLDKHFTWNKRYCNFCNRRYCSCKNPC